ncbi:MAG: AI-2E family transporter, partial [Gemmatimonadales bacterium]|nr:AI-2E family transporter [Gemmatimonadales bacterium]
ALDILTPGKAVSFVTAVLGWVAAAFGNGFLILLLAAIMLAHMAELHLRHGKGAEDGITFMSRVSALSVDVRPYVRITATTGLLFSVIITVVLMFLQVPYAAIWGVLAFFFNFLPQVGIILSWLPPAVIAMVTMGWPKAAAVIVAYTVINFAVDNVLKPKMMSTGLEISFLAIMLSLVFWGWVLGPAGAILSVPLTLAVRRFMEEFDQAPAPA